MLRNFAAAVGSSLATVHGCNDNNLKNVVQTSVSSSSRDAFLKVWFFSVNASLVCSFQQAFALCACQRFVSDRIHLCAGLFMGSLTLLISTVNSESGSDDSYAAVPRRHSAGSSNSNPPATSRYR